jgi:hypothetical protein
MGRIETTASGYEAHYFDSFDAFINETIDAYPYTFDDETLRLARYGWEDELSAVEDMQANMVDTVERETTSHHFETVYATSGAEVDVARYLSGEPEHMADYPLANISRAGRVITMAVSVTYSGGVSQEIVRLRGHVITAAAIALDRLGLNTEIWADRTIRSIRITRGPAISQRILIKGANDTIDPARILFATANRAMLHELCFAHCRYVTSWGRREGAKSGDPQDPEHFLPAGAIYLPTFNSRRDQGTPDMAVEALKTVLRQAGAID